MTKFANSKNGARVGAAAAGLIFSCTISGCGVERSQQYTVAVELTTSSPSMPANLPATPHPSIPSAASPSMPAPSPSAKIEEPPIGKVLQIKNGERVPMPLDPYTPSMEELKELSIARDAAADSCMRSLGFSDWEAGTIRSWSPESFREHDFFEYIDPSIAAKEGYVKPQSDPEMVKLSEVKPKKGPSEEQMAVYDGHVLKTKLGRSIPAGGCNKKAVAKVYGEIPDLPADPRALAVHSRIKALTDSRVKQAVSEWKACMAKHGLSYESPSAPPLDLRWASEDGGSPASAEEKRVASIDASCRQEVNITGIYKTVRIAYEERIMAENRDKLIATQRIAKKWSANASAILAESIE